MIEALITAFTVLAVTLLAALYAMVFLLWKALDQDMEGY